MAAIIEGYDKNKHDIGQLKALLALAVGRPTVEKLTYLIDQFYASEGRSIFVSVKKDVITGIIGIEHNGGSHGFITHLAVRPDMRKKGIASRLIKHVTSAFGLERIESETDQKAVEFYTACGFQTGEINSPYAGIRRFRCVKSLRIEVI
jgi:N-acetylglutamate synthase-like GNAT family acetyltransferase